MNLDKKKMPKIALFIEVGASSGSNASPLWGPTNLDKKKMPNHTYKQCAKNRRIRHDEKKKWALAPKGVLRKRLEYIPPVGTDQPG